MASSGSGYDLSSSTFSPDGRIFQVEYASKAVENAGTALGLKCRNGVVLCVEKPILNKMLSECARHSDGCADVDQEYTRVAQSFSVVFTSSI